MGSRLTWAVAMLQGAMLLTLFVTPDLISPPRVKFFELLWAWMRQPTFYPLVALMVAGPVLTVMALCIRGTHRLWLAGCWVVFLAIVVTYYPQRMMTMCRALYWVFTR